MVRTVYRDAFMKMSTSTQSSFLTGHSFVCNGVFAVLKYSMLKICVRKGYPMLNAKPSLSNSVTVVC